MSSAVTPAPISPSEWGSRACPGTHAAGRPVHPGSAGSDRRSAGRAPSSQQQRQELAQQRDQFWTRYPSRTTRRAQRQVPRRAIVERVTGTGTVLCSACAAVGPAPKSATVPARTVRRRHCPRATLRLRDPCSPDTSVAGVEWGRWRRARRTHGPTGQFCDRGQNRGDRRDGMSTGVEASAGHVRGRACQVRRVYQQH